MNNIHNLIKKAKNNFRNCLTLENQGHLSLKKALLNCNEILQKITIEQLKNLLKKYHITKKQEISEKHKAQAVLWLTVGKPNSKNPKELERQKARIRMYARILNKFIIQNIDTKTAEMFLDKYGVYAIANLKKLENKEDNTDSKKCKDEPLHDDEFDDDTSNNGSDNIGDEANKETDRRQKKSSQVRKMLKANGINKKRLILIKFDKKIYICTKRNATKSVINFLKEQNFGLLNINKI